MDMNDRPIVSSHSIRPKSLLSSCVWLLKPPLQSVYPLPFYTTGLFTNEPRFPGRGHPKNGARWRSNYDYNSTLAVLRAVRSRSSAEPGTEIESAIIIIPSADFDGLYNRNRQASKCTVPKVWEQTLPTFASLPTRREQDGSELGGKWIRALPSSHGNETIKP